MVARSQSLRPSAYLGANCRPSMPGRSLSGLSTMSIASSTSQQSDDVADEPSTHPTTPSHPSTSVEEPSSAKEKIDSTTRGAVVLSAPASRASLSRPIAIQVPRMKKFSSAPDCTPPEPLSARGDLIGGYFPMHEDPSVRVRQPHPFQHSAATGRADQTRVFSASVVGSFANPGSFMPSTYTSGAFDDFMSSGKYYPTNYEKRRSRQKPSESSASSSSSANERKKMQSGQKDAQPPARSQSLQSRASRGNPSTNATPGRRADAGPLPSSVPVRESEMKRQQMLQYQQDMINQTAMALRRTANEISQPMAGLRGPATASPRVANFASQGLDQPRRGAVAHRAISNDEMRSRHPGGAAGTLERLAEMSLCDQPARPSRQGARVAASAAAGQRGLVDPSMYLNPHHMPHRPISPKLVPLGSPGPVTPMDLDPSAAAGMLGRDQGPDMHRRTHRLQSLD